MQFFQVKSSKRWYRSTNGWRPSPTDSLWRQGKAERRNGVVKRLLPLPVGDKRLSPLELQTVLQKTINICKSINISKVLMQAIMGGVKGSGKLQVPVEKVIILPNEKVINASITRNTWALLRNPGRGKQEKTGVGNTIESSRPLFRTPRSTEIHVWWLLILYSLSLISKWSPQWGVYWTWLRRYVPIKFDLRTLQEVLPCSCSNDKKQHWNP